MNELQLLLSFILTKYSISVIGEKYNITIPIGALENFTLSNGTNKNDINITKILRYGFHDTSKCRSFERSYACIHMCLSAGYDIARSNRDCVCKCYKDTTKELYFKHIDKTWKLPTTKKPFWAGGELKEEEEEEIVITQEGFDIINHPSTEIRTSRTTPSTEIEQKSVTTGNETAKAVSIDDESLTTVSEAGNAVNSDDVTSATEENNDNTDDTADVTSATEDNNGDTDDGAAVTSASEDNNGNSDDNAAVTSAEADS